MRAVDPRHGRRLRCKRRFAKSLTGGSFGELALQLLRGSGLVEVAAGALGELTHDAPHLLLRGRARLGQHGIDERGKLLAGQLLGKQLFEHLHLGREHVGTLLVVAGLDGSLQRLLGLLDDAFRHIVDVLLGDVAALIHLDVLDLAVHLAKDGQAYLVVCLHGLLDVLFQLVVLHVCSLISRSCGAWRQVFRFPV